MDSGCHAEDCVVLSTHQRMRGAAELFFECAAEMGDVGEAKAQCRVGDLSDAALGQRLVTGGKALLP